MPIAPLAELPPTLRALFSSFLLLMGIAYLMALFLLFLVDVDTHQRMGMGLVSGIVAKYHGTSGRGTRLEAALRGVMADKIDPGDRDRLLRWIHDGAPETGYAAVKPIFDRNCVTCHNTSSAPQLPSLVSYQDIRKFTQIDTGPSLAQLAEVSHVHLFGISIIFLLTGAIFSLSETPVWLRASLVVVPYLAIVADIGSWWLTRFDPVFGIVVVVGGALMGLSLAGQILIALWEMWLPVPWLRALAGSGRR
jgi:hypothetical protein